jgi:hypothetical protein
MSFVFAETEGIQAAAATTSALAGTTVGGSGQAAAAGAVVPPGIEEVSAANAAKIAAYTSEVASLLGAAAGFQELYGTSVSVAGLLYDATDVANGIGMAL